MAKTFRGGVHVPEFKNTRGCKVYELPAPAVVSIPMQQHIGAPAAPLVKKGDTVKAGQVIGRFDEGLSCPVHATVSGTVKDIEMRPSYTGYGKTAHVVIENDFQNTLSEDIKPYSGDIYKIPLKELVETVKNAGISGMGGAAFPTYAKIASAEGKAEDIIVNCAECEPYITANHRLMLEEPDSIVGGAKIIMNALGAKKTYIAVEDNKKDAADLLTERTKKDENITVEILKTKYPQGDERQLIFALKGVELPSGKLPSEVGSVIFNAETCAAVYHAVKDGMPLIKRIVTVDGDCVNEPKNVRVPFGTSYEDIFDFCGGISEETARIISGGPMMGSTQWDYNAVVMKNTSAILVLPDDNIKISDESDCIHCGRCVGVCPMHLMPSYLAAFSKAENNDMCERFGVLSCVECGSCTYVCPARVPIVQHIRNSKSEIIAAKKKLAAAKDSKK